ncbi:glycosyl hydrolase [Paenibacillus hexagrammi]|uniref:glucan endo-1,3-beta-D-glucosidase n=1 Tax=Paenibacillus hexagrammi TaxID=2908839 RepID=A0ABY3SE12_9BACL|nr:glycosyl hydrolase [Paenibacillus sp. YPD9-1]UJF32228.1 glycoside hydrolase family 81 [Paenibacillus sp. YPD9-1]
MSKTLHSLIAFVLLLALALPTSASAFSGEVPAGAGSYSTVLPSGASDAPSTIYKTNSVTQKMPTNDWWSSLAWTQYSERMYPHPLAVRNKAEGFQVYYPTITANSGCICGWMPAPTDANGNDDFTIGHSAQATFPDAKVDSFNDWFVTSSFTSGANSLKATYGHGSPYVYFTYAGGNPKLTFPSAPTIWSGNANSAVLGVTFNGRHYALFGPSGSTWSGIGSSVLTNNLNGKNYFSIALLPDNTAATLSKFQQYAYNHITNTTVNYAYNPSDSTVTTTYTYTTTAKEGTGSGTIFALYPHQWKNTTKTLLNYTYNSVRGTMKVAEGTSFTTSMKFTGVLPSLPDKGSYNKTTLAGYVNEAEAQTYTGGSDTYWLGKEMGRLATLAPIADQVGDTTAANKFRGDIKSDLEDYFKASDASGNLQTQKLFYYNSNWGTMIGYPSSFGSAEELNDHHFHYGYFIKAAAEIARVDKTWASDSNWGAMVNLLIRDIASPNRNDSMFPFLRNFDIYAGHSWASGHANFGDGNNNESSSEAMNAWAGVILWGEATGNTSIRDLGIYLYTTEMNAINEYWFDVNDNTHPADYTPSVVTMVWGGKGANGTWFTGNPEQVHGINYLPLTAGHLYLTHYPSYTAKNYNAMAAENGGTNWDAWKDLIWMYRAISDPTDAKNQFNAGIGSLTPEEGNSKANTYHWIYNLDAMGNADKSITANYPLAVVFNKNGVKTYVVYNMTNASKTVTFSDGTTVTAPANSFNGGGSTPPPSDTQAPSAPTNVTSPAKTSSSVSLSWTGSTDNVGVAGYEISRNGSVVGTTASSSYTDNGLAASTAYSYTVKAYDAAGNRSAASAALNVTTSAASGADTQAPTVPTNLGATNTSSSVTLSWTASTDNVGVAGYDILRAGIPIATTTSTSFTDSGLSNNTNYIYSVKAFDAAGNRSAATADIYVTTGTSSGDTQAPTVPASLTSTSQTSSSVTLSWAASSDNVGITGYEILRNGAVVGTSATTGYTDSGLTAGTAYTYTVKAYDAAGNRSAASGSLNVTTLASGGSGPFTTADYTAGTTKLSASEAKIYFTPNGYSSAYVDVHYKINGGTQSNFRMTNNSGTWETTVSGLSTGNTIQYWFTYNKGSVQYDTVSYTHTQ